MIRLHRIALTRDNLDSIPESDRILIISLAHAANELNVLTKLFYFCSKQEAETPLLVEARNAQTMVLGRLLTGKIYECWVLMQRAFFKAKLSKEYELKFDDEAKSALDSLKQYFSRENLIKNIRNWHAFHYAPDRVSRGYSSLLPHDCLDVYLSERNANSLYVFAETICGRALLETINPTDHSKAMDDLIGETSRMIGYINRVIGACIATCFSQYIGGDLDALGANIVEIGNARDWKSVTIPFFVEIGDEAS